MLSEVHKTAAMKKFLLPAVLSLSILFQGCLKDSYEHTYSYTYYKPVYKTTAEVRSNIKSNAPKPVEQPGKIYLLGQYIFLNEMDKGIHVIDNSNPAQPKNIAFIDIPGNLDIAVKGNTLYADLYTDLVAIDISDPMHVTLKKVVEDVFPHRYYNGYFTPDSTRIIASWEKRDTTVTEKSQMGGWLKSTDIFMSYAAGGVNNSSGGAVSVSPVGVGGSMARFTIANNRLYTVGTADLNVFNITSSFAPVNVARKNLGWNIETIYPFMDKLFIGSSSGMFIYNITNPDNPVQIGQFAHFESCDPVIADNQFAYVTLRSGSVCQGFTNELEVLQLNNLTNPSLLKVYPMVNPHGLSKDGSTLFVCDGREGLKIYDAGSVTNMQLIKKISGLEAYDVIAMNGNAIVVAKDGLYQFNYSNTASIYQVSRITISQ